jgi:hypothetical protein
LLIGNQYEADISNSRAIAMLRRKPAELLQAFVAAREWVGLASPIERASTTADVAILGFGTCDLTVRSNKPGVGRTCPTRIN